MKHTLMFTGLIAMMACLLVAAKKPPKDPNQNAADAWLTSYTKAVEQAKASGKPILADFTGSDWCGWCIKLKKEVLDTDEFKKWAADNVILLEVDFPQAKPQTPEIKKQNAELQKKYKVRGFPTVLVIGADGKEIGRVVGYPGAEKWNKQIKDFVAKAKPSTSK